MHQQGDSERGVSQKLCIARHGLQCVFNKSLRKQTKEEVEGLRKLSTADEQYLKSMSSKP